MYCKKCGAQMDRGAKFCTSCEAAYDEDQHKEQQYTVTPERLSGRAEGKKLSGSALILIIIGVAMLIGAAIFAVIYFTDSSAEGTAPVVSRAVASPKPKITAAPAQTSESTSAPTQRTVKNAQIPVKLAESTGTILYTGVVDENGLPNGEGTGKMEADNEGNSWTYTGMWEHGRLCGAGELTHITNGYSQRGEFKNDVLNGYGTQTMNGVLRYEGQWLDGDLHGQGKLYTRTGELLYEGELEHNLLAESQAKRESRAAPFMENCESMNASVYASWEDGKDISGYPVSVWGSIAGLGEQTQTGTVIINMHDDTAYHIALSYRYGVDEPKVTAKDGSVSAWGYCVGTFEYTMDGKAATCPQIEVVYWLAGSEEAAPAATPKQTLTPTKKPTPTSTSKPTITKKNATLKSGSSVKLSFPGSSTVYYIAFTAPKDGYYTIWSTGSLDTKASVGEKKGGSDYGSNDNGGSGKNFKLELELGSGQKVYITCKIKSGSGDVKVFAKAE